MSEVWMCEDFVMEVPAEIVEALQRAERVHVAGETRTLNRMAAGIRRMFPAGRAELADTTVGKIAYTRPRGDQAVTSTTLVATVYATDFSKYLEDLRPTDHAEVIRLRVQPRVPLLLNQVEVNP